MSKLNKEEIVKIAALMIHASKLDENFTEKEKKLVINFVKNNCSENSDELNIFQEAEKLENNTNQLLNYTNIIKQKSLEIKKDIIAHLWKVIISDNTVDQYESNLMRRICGLIYFPDKESAEIKLQIMNNK